MTRQMTVYGVPQSKGSTRSFVVKGKTVTTSTNRNLAAWSALVANEAQRTADGQPLLEGPLTVMVTFYLPKPKSAKANAMPDKRPDIDKLLRAVLDPLHGKWFRDDAQVVTAWANKQYGDPPRVVVVCTEAVR